MNPSITSIDRNIMKENSTPQIKHAQLLSAINNMFIRLIFLLVIIAPGIQFGQWDLQPENFSATSDVITNPSRKNIGMDGLNSEGGYYHQFKVTLSYNEFIPDAIAPNWILISHETRVRVDMDNNGSYELDYTGSQASHQISFDYPNVLPGEFSEYQIHYKINVEYYTSLGSTMEDVYDIYFPVKIFPLPELFYNSSNDDLMVGYVSADGVLDRPLIIVEGFDVENTMWPSQLYGRTEPFITNHLKPMGYDIFILNFAIGGKNLQENAMVLMGALDMINNLNLSFETSILGISMGGILSRFALAWAEENSLDHGCGLFISYDSPQRGAYVNSQLQNLIANYDGGHSEIENLALVMQSDAAKQLLIYNTFDPPVPGEDNSEWEGGPMYNEFFTYLNELNSTGYPSETENIAISNGQGNVESQNIYSSYPDAVAGSSLMSLIIEGYPVLTVEVDERDVYPGSYLTSWPEESVNDQIAIPVPFMNYLRIEYELNFSGPPSFIWSESALDLRGVVNDLASSNGADIISWDYTPFDEIFLQPDGSYAHDIISNNTLIFLLETFSRHIEQETLFKNISLENGENLGGFLSVDGLFDWIENPIPSGEYRVIPSFTDVIVRTTSQFLNDGLQQHYQWNNNLMDFELFHDRIYTIGIQSDEIANFKDVTIININGNTESIKFYDPWYLENPEDDILLWNHPHEFRNFSEIAITGEHRVFMEQYPDQGLHYLLKSPELIATENEIYQFVEWSGTGVDFGNGTNVPSSDLETTVVFIEENAHINPIYTQINNVSGDFTLDRDEVLMFPKNFNISFADNFNLIVNGELQNNSTDSGEKSLLLFGVSSSIRKEPSGEIYLSNIIFKNNYPDSNIVEMDLKYNNEFVKHSIFENCVFENIHITANAQWTSDHDIQHATRFESCTIVNSPMTLLSEEDTYHDLLYRYSILMSSDVNGMDRSLSSDIIFNDCDYFNSLLPIGAIIYDSITDDPLFVSATDYNLTYESPCRDIVTGQYDPDGTIKDIGAYYFHQLPGDVNTDITVDILDVSTIISYTMDEIELSDNQLYNGDVNDDSQVNIMDVILIVDCILNFNCGQLERSKASALGYGHLRSNQSHDLARSDDMVNIITLNADVPVRGVQLDVEYNHQEHEFTGVELLEDASGLILEYNNETTGIIKLVLYPNDMFQIPIGEHDILQLEFDGLERSTNNSADMTITEEIISGPNGMRIIIGEPNLSADEFQLYPAYPNPFNPIVNIGFDIPKENSVRLIVFDMLGREVEVLIDNDLNAGTHYVKWDASDMASGIYMIKMISGKKTESCLLDPSIVFSRVITNYRRENELFLILRCA